MTKKKKIGFGQMGNDQVRPSVSMKELLSDDEPVDTKDINKVQDSNNDNMAKKPVEDKETATTNESQEAEPEKEAMERHDFFFSESLSDQIFDFMRTRKPREKNKTRLLRVILYDFFDKTPEQQTKIYTNGLKKFKDKL